MLFRKYALRSFAHTQVSVTPMLGLVSCHRLAPPYSSFFLNCGWNREDKFYIFFLTRVRIGIRIWCQVYLTVLHIKTTNKIKILAVWRRIRIFSNLFASLSRINLRPLSLYQCFATLYIICLCVKEGRYKDRTLTNMTFIKLARYQIAFKNH